MLLSELASAGRAPPPAIILALRSKVSRGWSFSSGGGALMMQSDIVDVAVKNKRLHFLLSGAAAATASVALETNASTRSTSFVRNLFPARPFSFSL